jgi:citrate lyase beta subunit
MLAEAGAFAASALAETGVFAAPAQAEAGVFAASALAEAGAFAASAQANADDFAASAQAEAGGMLDAPRQALSVGALLYVPALHSGAAGKILGGELAQASSIAFCLEDSIRDEAILAAEAQLFDTMRQLHAHAAANGGIPHSPMIFVRIRNPLHMLSLYNALGGLSEMITGFILPKFDLSNIAAYSEAICEINATRRDRPLYIMPILESKSLADLKGRPDVLSMLHRRLAFIAEYVLNIRVGGNDILNVFGLRRSSRHTIYDIGPARGILFDILNVFSPDYVVSAPVWEYFRSGDGDAGWLEGLRRELELDKLNGFIGKTAIHPSQIPVINESLKVSMEDYSDAIEIIGWKQPAFAVSKSGSGHRMNEAKVHRKWAARILKLAEIYGIGDGGAHRPEAVGTPGAVRALAPEAANTPGAVRALAPGNAHTPEAARAHKPEAVGTPGAVRALAPEAANTPGAVRALAPGNAHTPEATYAPRRKMPAPDMP